MSPEFSALEFINVGLCGRKTIFNLLVCTFLRELKFLLSVLNRINDL
jgi:hypothetical protein